MLVACSHPDTIKYTGSIKTPSATQYHPSVDSIISKSPLRSKTPSPTAPTQSKKPAIPLQKTLRRKSSFVVFDLPHVRTTLSPPCSPLPPSLRRDAQFPHPSPHLSPSTLVLISSSDPSPLASCSTLNAGGTNCGVLTLARLYCTHRVSQTAARNRRLRHAHPAGGVAVAVQPTLAPLFSHFSHCRAPRPHTFLTCCASQSFGDRPGWRTFHHVAALASQEHLPMKTRGPCWRARVHAHGCARQ